MSRFTLARGVGTYLTFGTTFTSAEYEHVRKMALLPLTSEHPVFIYSSYKAIQHFGGTMLELSETARKELEAFFADKKKETIRVYSVNG